MGVDKTIAMPDFGIIGLPPLAKESGNRVDFAPKQFEMAIEAKGYRLAWSRACPCPCAPVNSQTEQPDPNCLVCKGLGWLWFGPDRPLQAEKIGEINVVQQAIIDASQAAVIRGVMVNITRQMQPQEKIGVWVAGTSTLTVRQENRLGYYDRVTNLDSTIVYSEIVKAGAPLTPGTTPLPTRYFVVEVNLVRTVGTVFKYGIDYELDRGVLRFYQGKAPPKGTPVAVHYHMHPTWLVIDHPHAMRGTSIIKKKDKFKTPQGDPIHLPVQAAVKYEFLVTS